MRRQRSVVLVRRVAERGAALIVALILLIVITLVGLAAISSTILQNKATSNQFDREIAFQSAEAALRVATASIPTNPSWIVNGYCTPNPSSPGPCLLDPFNDPNLPGGSASFHTVSSGFTASSVAAMQPQFVIESLGYQTNQSVNTGFGNTANVRNYGVQGGSQTVPFYRITARSCDPSKIGCAGRALVVLQIVVKQG